MTAPQLAGVGLTPMGRADLPQVLAIEVAVASRPWSQATFLVELNRADRRYLVARPLPVGSEDPGVADPGVQTVAGGGAAGGGAAGGGAAGGDPGPEADVVGFAGVALYPDEAHVMTIAVDPAVQGRGIGARLVAGMLDEVARAGLAAATLEVRAGNVAARRLYRRAGFEDAGVRSAYYPDGEDAVIMWRRPGAEVS